MQTLRLLAGCRALLKAVAPVSRLLCQLLLGLHASLKLSGRTQMRWRTRQCAPSGHLHCLMGATNRTLSSLQELLTWQRQQMRIGQLLPSSSSSSNARGKPCPGLPRFPGCMKPQHMSPLDTLMFEEERGDVDDATREVVPETITFAELSGLSDSAKEVPDTLLVDSPGPGSQLCEAEEAAPSDPEQGRAETAADSLQLLDLAATQLLETIGHDAAPALQPVPLSSPTAGPLGAPGSGQHGEAAGEAANGEANEDLLPTQPPGQEEAGPAAQALCEGQEQQQQAGHGSQPFQLPPDTLVQQEAAMSHAEGQQTPEVSEKGGPDSCQAGASPGGVGTKP